VDGELGRVGAGDPGGRQLRPEEWTKGGRPRGRRGAHERVGVGALFTSPVTKVRPWHSRLDSYCGQQTNLRSRPRQMRPMGCLAGNPLHCSSSFSSSSQRHSCWVRSPCLAFSRRFVLEVLRAAGFPLPLMSAFLLALSLPLMSTEKLLRCSLSANAESLI